MAGTILINDTISVAMSGVEFEHVVEAIRPFLSAKNSAIVDEAYNPLDEGGMDFISVETLNIEDFNVFCDAALSAFGDEMTKNSITEFQSVWNEVLSNLNSDPRRAEKQKGGVPRRF